MKSSSTEMSIIPTLMPARTSGIAADQPAAVIACGGVVIAGSPRGTREVAAPDFCVDTLTSDLAHDEILLEIRIPIPQTTTSQSAVQYMEETTFTNAAAETAGGDSGSERLLRRHVDRPDDAVLAVLAACPVKPQPREHGGDAEHGPVEALARRSARVRGSVGAGEDPRLGVAHQGLRLVACGRKDCVRRNVQC